MAKRCTGRGFTLVELLVVVAITVTLLAMLVPAMEGAVEQARRAKCGANQHAIGIGSNTYAYNNRGDYIICRQRTVTMYFSPGEAHSGADRMVDWIGALSSVGLFGPTKVQQDAPGSSSTFDYPPGQVWACPSARYPVRYEGVNPPSQPAQKHFNINYQYLGGVQTWKNRWVSAAGIESSSPVKLSTSRTAWVLAAEANGIVSQTSGANWSSGVAFTLGFPPHRDSTGPWPAGGNQLYVDGSGRFLNRPWRFIRGVPTTSSSLRKTTWPAGIRRTRRGGRRG